MRETETEKFGSKKKNEKKKRKRGRERRSVARPTTTRESRGPVFVVSFLFRLNLFLFFFVRRESRLIQTQLVSRARIFISSSLRAEYQHQHQHHRTHASTRAPFVVGKSFGKSSESRGEVREEQKRKSGNRSRVREEETEIGRDEESTRKINTREAWKRTKNSSNSSKDTHRTAQTHARTETRTQRERGTDNTQREIE